MVYYERIWGAVNIKKNKKQEIIGFSLPFNDVYISVTNNEAILDLCFDFKLREKIHTLVID